MKNFKFNWGHGMVLALLCFMIFIISFLVRFQYQKGNSLDLVTEDYYNKGLNFQEHYEAINNANSLSAKPQINLLNKQLQISFPENISVINGKLGIYRPSNKNLDHEFPLKLNNGVMTLNEKAFQPGKYNIHLYWEDENKTPYFIEKEIIWK